MKEEDHEYGRRERRKRLRLLIKQAYDPGNWFQFPRVFLLVMSSNEAILLAYLVNHSSAVKAEEKRRGWFFCPMKKIVADLYWSEDRQTRTMKTLEDKGFIVTRKRGIPAKRWIRIHYRQLRVEINRAFKDWNDGANSQ